VTHLLAPLAAGPVEGSDDGAQRVDHDQVEVTSETLHVRTKAVIVTRSSDGLPCPWRSHSGQVRGGGLPRALVALWS